MLISRSTKEPNYWPAYILDPRLFVQWVEEEMQYDYDTFHPILISMTLGVDLKVSSSSRWLSFGRRRSLPLLVFCLDQRRASSLAKL